MRGWYAVTDATADAAPRRIEGRLGRTLVTWGTSDGPRVADAFCPHLGADLSMGSVNEGMLRCPFHGWEFDGDGALVEIPYCDRLRDAPLRTYPVTETDGRLWVWPDGEPDFALTPRFTVGFVEARHVERVTRACQSDTLENGVDIGHFNQLHNQPDIRLGKWAIPHTPHPSVALHYDAIDLNISIDYYGPGLVVLRFRDFVEMELVVSYTPTGDSLTEGGTHLSLGFWLPPHPKDSALADYMVEEITQQFDQDIAIWDRKVYLERPLLCAADGPMMQMRRWVKEFTQ